MLYDLTFLAYGNDALLRYHKDDDVEFRLRLRLKNNHYYKRYANDEVNFYEPLGIYNEFRSHPFPSSMSNENEKDGYYIFDEVISLDLKDRSNNFIRRFIEILAGLHLVSQRTEYLKMQSISEEKDLENQNFHIRSVDVLGNAGHGFDLQVYDRLVSQYMKLSSEQMSRLKDSIWGIAKGLGLDHLLGADKGNQGSIFVSLNQFSISFKSGALMCWSLDSASHNRLIVRDLSRSEQILGFLAFIAMNTLLSNIEAAKTSEA